MAGVLNFSDYLGGPDNVQCEQIFPGDQRTLQYDFGVNITNWTFKIEAQTIVVNPLTFDRDGTPNFSTSQVVGYFNADVVGDTSVADSDYINLINVSSGIVDITVPKNLYTGPILPDARQNVPITVISVSWTGVDDPYTNVPKPTNTHRWAFIQCWEPGVTPGDPTITQVTTTLTGWTGDNSGTPTHLQVASTVGIQPDATVTIDGNIYHVGTVESGTSLFIDTISGRGDPWNLDAVIGSAISFENDTTYLSLI